MKNQGSATVVESLGVQGLPAKVKDECLASLFQKGKHSP